MPTPRPIARTRRLLLVIAILALAAAAATVTATAPTRAEPAVTVFAASSLTDALTAVGAAYRRQTGGDLRFSFAASSTLARQIEAGAPADVVLSADTLWMDYLEARGLIDPQSRTTALGNVLVLVAPADDRADAKPGDTAVLDPATADWSTLLPEGARLAVGDPDHVPAGRYARQALEHLGLWDALASRLARADNVRAALALVARGEAPLGIVYATDAAITDAVRVIGRFPPDSHAPIAYPIAVVAGTDQPEAAASVRDVLIGDAALAVYRDLGFVPLGTDPPS